jgi:hypothetical protein
MSRIVCVSDTETGSAQTEEYVDLSNLSTK